MKPTLDKTLQQVGACIEAREWAAKQPNLETAWQECERGDWLLWFALKLGVERKVYVRAAVACARLALPFVAANDDRPLRAIQAVESWCEGSGTIEEVRAAAHAAAEAAYDVAATDAAAHAAAEAAYDVAAAAHAVAAAYADAVAHAAADAAAHAAAYAANLAAAKEARAAMLGHCAAAVRGVIPFDRLLPLWLAVEVAEEGNR